MYKTATRTASVLAIFLLNPLTAQTAHAQAPAAAPPAATEATTGFQRGDLLVWGAVGVEGDLGGGVNSSGIGLVNGLNAEMNANTWGERYTPAMYIQYGVALAGNRRTQVLFSGHWEQSEADSNPVGLIGGQPLIAEFSDYQGWGLDLGVRHLIPSTSRAKPFVSASIGFQHIQEISATLSSIPVGFVAQDVPFYAASWVTQWKVGGGLLWALTPRVGWQASLDIKYSGVLSDEAGLGALGFERFNDTGNRWSLPLLAGIYVKF